MGEVREYRKYESQQEFIDDIEKEFGTFDEIDSNEQFITLFIPHRELDMMVYNPFIAKNADGDCRVVIISWKSDGDASIEEKLKDYARSLLVKEWFICKWPRAEGGVRIGDLILRNTHHRVLMIRYI